MVRGRDVKSPHTEVRRSVRIGRQQGVRGLQQRGDADVISQFGALGELHSDLHREGAPMQEHVGRLTIERATRGHRDTGTHRFARDVVPESQVLAALGEQIGLQELTDRREQHGRRPLERSREIPERERPAKGRGDGRDVPRGVR